MRYHEIRYQVIVTLASAFFTLWAKDEVMPWLETTLHYQGLYKKRPTKKPAFRIRNN